MIQLTHAKPYMRTGQSLCMTCLYAGTGSRITQEETLTLLRLFRRCNLSNARVHRHNQLWLFESELNSTWVGLSTCFSFEEVVEKINLRYGLLEERDVRLDP